MNETKDFVVPDFSNSEKELILSEEEWGEICQNSDKVERKISTAQLNSIAQWTKGLRPEEVLVVIDNLPLDLLFAKIGKELEKNKKFTEAITNAMSIIK